MKILTAEEARKSARRFNERKTKKYVMESIHEISGHGGTYARLPKEDFEYSWRFIVEWLGSIGYECLEQSEEVIISW